MSAVPNIKPKVSNQDSKIIFSCNSKPFGETKPNEDADNDGNKFTLNLRFPEQYFDKESGKYYNRRSVSKQQLLVVCSFALACRCLQTCLRTIRRLRDYDPITGRYIQSDPIGFEDGSNTYVYIGGNPLVRFDESGLLVDATYDRTSNKFIVVDLEKPYKVAKMKAFSGGAPFGDPIPLGDWEILERAGKKDFFRLDAIDSNPRNDTHDPTGRTNFRLHKNGRTIGCIVAASYEEWVKVRDLIYATRTTIVEMQSQIFYGLWNTTEKIIKYGTLHVVD